MDNQQQITEYSQVGHWVVITAWKMVEEGKSYLRTLLSRVFLYNTDDK